MWGPTLFAHHTHRTLVSLYGIAAYTAHPSPPHFSQRDGKTHLHLVIKFDVEIAAPLIVHLMERDPKE